MAEALRSELLGGLPHGFMTRSGGVSTGPAAGLQCGYGADDDPQAVCANRRLAVETVLPGAELVSVHQIHSPDVAVVEEPWGDDERPHADALVTRRPGVLLGIVTADCAPVLLADRAAGVIGAAHAGWRGAHGGVIDNTVEAMVALGAERARITAAVGPCIAQPSYEVDASFRAQFGDEEARFFAPGKAGRWQFDLPGYVLMRLQSAGIGTAHALGLDTYADPERFYSYRRATHRGEATYGRLISLIGMAR